MPRPAWLRKAVVAGVSVLALAAAAGCSGGSDHGGILPPTPSAGGGTGRGTANPPEPPAASAGGATAAEDRPARTTGFAAPGGVAGRIEVGFIGLRVDGMLATLTLTFTPHYDAEPADPNISIYEMFGRHSPSITLVDTINLKRYVLVRDSKGGELGAQATTTQTRNNVPARASYTFAAPSAGVRTLDVYADDRMLFDNAEIIR
jgi:hypothetical protein